ncbi:putative glycoside hydrolase family 15 protein, partial [Candidatus Aminicenantes bacterium AC-708-I09]|nr:putative glycoside hydrolase family 15 protein [Candidatus Aminicenantes bacterium AC-708-I09]
RDRNYDLSERLRHHLYPKLFLQIQGYAPSEERLNEAFNWDLLVLDAELVANFPEYLGSNGKIRQNNPYAIILLYFSAADVIPGNTATVNGGFISGLKDEWYMKDINGARYLLFELSPGDWTEMLNLTTLVNSYMPNYLNEHVISTNLGDGIFFDWIMESIAWLNHRTDTPSALPDIDNDGIADSDSKLDSLWINGTKKLLINCHNIFPSGTLITGNGGWDYNDPPYKNIMNGSMIESFLNFVSTGEFVWHGLMRAYYLMQEVLAEPMASMMTLSSGNQNDFKFMRFAFASTLMFDGYFCYTNSGLYGEPWWYDEYSVNNFTGEAVKSLGWKGYLGSPVSEAYDAENSNILLKDLLLNDDTTSEEKVWRRDFEYGTVLVNPSLSSKTVNLNGNFRKIKGIYDPSFNNGQENITSITLEPRSGVVLLNYNLPPKKKKGRSRR